MSLCFSNAKTFTDLVGYSLTSTMTSAKLTHVHNSRRFSSFSLMMSSFWFDPLMLVNFLPLLCRPCQKLQSKCFSAARTSHHCWACNNYFQILPYVNGTLYSLLSHGRFALAAKDLGIEQKLIEVTQKLDGDGETRSTAVLYWCHDTASSAQWCSHFMTRFTCCCKLAIYKWIYC